MDLTLVRVIKFRIYQYHPVTHKLQMFSHALQLIVEEPHQRVHSSTLYLDLELLVAPLTRLSSNYQHTTIAKTQICHTLVIIRYKEIERDLLLSHHRDMVLVVSAESVLVLIDKLPLGLLRVSTTSLWLSCCLRCTDLFNIEVVLCIVILQELVTLVTVRR